MLTNKLIYLKSANNFILSTATGLYSFESLEEYEQIYSGQNITSFLPAEDYVYFVSNIDG